MPLTEEEIQQVNEAIQNGQPLTDLEPLKPLIGHEALVIDTKKGIQTLTDSAVQKAIDERTNEWAGSLEKDIKELTGIEKEPNEKYYQYYKRAIPAVKGDPQRVQELESQLEELKKDGKFDPMLKKELDELKTQQSKMTETHQQELKRLQEEKTQYIKRTEISRGLTGLKFKDSLPEGVVAREREYAVNQMLNQPSEIREQDGRTELVFLDENGQALRNADNTYMQAHQIASKLLADSLADGTGGKGAGSNSGKGGGAPKPAKSGADFGVNFDIPEEIESMEELDDFLKEQGIASNSKEYGKIYQHYSKEVKLPISKRFGSGLKK